jgi:dTDP-4-dehydrorhamnose 3,5-epimerase
VPDASGLASDAAAGSTEKAACPAAIDFHDGDIEGVSIRPLEFFTDRRGWLAEVYREDELPAEFHPVMAYVSETRPGVARGPHEHVDQTDLFVFLGPGDFDLYLWDARPDSPTRGTRLRRTCGQSRPCVVIVPPGVVHAYKNVSDRPGWVINGPNRLYAGPGKSGPVDEIRHENDEGSPYRLE